MTTIYAYFAECDKCGHLAGPLNSFEQASGVSNNHNANVHKGKREAYPVTEKIEV